MSQIRVAFGFCFGKPYVMCQKETVVNLSSKIGSVWLQAQSYNICQRVLFRERISLLQPFNHFLPERFGFCARINVLGKTLRKEQFSFSCTPILERKVLVDTRLCKNVN